MEMPEKPAYRGISIKDEFATSVETFVNEHPEFGYRSIAQFLEDSARRRLEDLKAQIKILPRFEKINCDAHGCKILDRQMKRVADVHFKPEGIRCGIDLNDTCEHVEFALSLKEVQTIVKKLRAEGWKLPDV
jgi:hypothetical protein